MTGKTNADIVALRCYAKMKPKKKDEEKDDDWEPEAIQVADRPCHSSSRVLVFDTETTVDMYQNLLFGSCGVWTNGVRENVYIFYADDLTDGDVSMLRAYAERHGYVLLTRTEFVESVFFPLVYEEAAMCVGFNLPYDLSRLAIRCGGSRGLPGGFSLILSRNNRWPRVAIKSLDSKRAFIRFARTYRRKSDRKYRFNRGYFLDMKTFTFALTGNPYSLAKAAEDFGCTLRKTSPEEHGRITPEYIDYNVNDVMTTYELYLKAMERYKLFCLDLGPNKLYSPASIGKAYLEKMGIAPFHDKNPGFPEDVLGHVMGSYTGGRCECPFRKTPVKVTYLDFVSMYPTTYVLHKLDMLLKAAKITYQENTEEVQRFLDRVTVDDVGNPALWRQLTTMCRIRPDNDILPVRAQYGDPDEGDTTYTIDLNPLESRGPEIWYTLADLIGSKLLTGRAPRILEVVTFRPEGVQPGLNEIEILPGVTVKPDEDFIKRLIEERQKVKKIMKTETGEARHQLDLKQHILKIVANSTSYGIYIEMNAKSTKPLQVVVHALDTFEAEVTKIETEGRAFNPIMATFITAGARLILAAAEALVTRSGGEFVYCDTDSIFIGPDRVQLVQDFFRGLNPYSTPMEMFKVEEDDEGHPLVDVWFYGISAKRYVLYDRDPLTGEIKIRKYSSHGLGGMMNFEPED